MRRASSITIFPEPGEWWKMHLEYYARNFKCIRGPYNHCRECGHLYFRDFILHNYLRDQGVGLGDLGSSANVRSNLTKIPNQGGSAHQSAFEVRDKFKQFLNSPPGTVPWQNERVQCQVNL